MTTINDENKVPFVHNIDQILDDQAGNDEKSLKIEAVEKKLVGHNQATLSMLDILICGQADDDSGPPTSRSSVSSICTCDDTLERTSSSDIYRLMQAKLVSKAPRVESVRYSFSMKCEHPECEATFYIAGRHHCRRCGLSICGAHSMKNVVTDERSWPRLCFACLRQVGSDSDIDMIENRCHSGSFSSIGSQSSLLSCDSTSTAGSTTSTMLRYLSAMRGNPLAAVPGVAGELHSRHRVRRGQQEHLQSQIPGISQQGAFNESSLSASPDDVAATTTLEGAIKGAREQELCCNQVISASRSVPTDREEISPVDRVKAAISTVKCLGSFSENNESRAEACSVAVPETDEAKKQNDGSETSRLAVQQQSQEEGKAVAAFTTGCNKKHLVVKKHHGQYECKGYDKYEDGDGEETLWEDNPLLLEQIAGISESHTRSMGDSQLAVCSPLRSELYTTATVACRQAFDHTQYNYSTFQCAKAATTTDTDHLTAVATITAGHSSIHVDTNADQLTTDTTSASDHPTTDTTLASDHPTTDTTPASDHLTTDTTPASDQLTTDTTLASDQFTTDTTLASDQFNTDTTPASDHLTTDTTPASDHLTTDTTPASDHLTTDTTPASDHLTTDTTLASDHLTTDTTLASDQLTTDTTPASDHLTTNTTPASDHLTTDTTPASDHLTTDTTPDSDNLTTDTTLASDQLTINITLASDHLTTNTTSASDQVTTDTTPASVHLTTDTTLASDHRTTDTTLASDHLTTDTTPASDHLTTDTTPASDHLTTDTTPASDHLTTDTTLASDHPTTDTTPASDHLTTDTTLASDHPTTDTTLASDHLTTDTTLASDHLTTDTFHLTIIPRIYPTAITATVRRILSSPKIKCRLCWGIFASALAVYLFLLCNAQWSGRPQEILPRTGSSMPRTLYPCGPSAEGPPEGVTTPPAGGVICDLSKQHSTPSQPMHSQISSRPQSPVFINAPDVKLKPTWTAVWESIQPEQQPTQKKQKKQYLPPHTNTLRVQLMVPLRAVMARLIRKPMVLVSKSGDGVARPIRRFTQFFKRVLDSTGTSAKALFRALTASLDRISRRKK